MGGGQGRQPACLPGTEAKSQQTQVVTLVRSHKGEARRSEGAEKGGSEDVSMNPRLAVPGGPRHPPSQRWQGAGWDLKGKRDRALSQGRTSGSWLYLVCPRPAGPMGPRSAPSVEWAEERVDQLGPMILGTLGLCAPVDPPGPARMGPTFTRLKNLVSDSLWALTSKLLILFRYVNSAVLPVAGHSVGGLPQPQARPLLSRPPGRPREAAGPGQSPGKSGPTLRLRPAHSSPFCWIRSWRRRQTHWRERLWVALSLSRHSSVSRPIWWPSMEGMASSWGERAVSRPGLAPSHHVQASSQLANSLSVPQAGEAACGRGARSASAQGPGPGSRKALRLGPRLCRLWKVAWYRL